MASRWPEGNMLVSLHNPCFFVLRYVMVSCFSVLYTSKHIQHNSLYVTFYIWMGTSRLGKD